MIIIHTQGIGVLTTTAPLTYIGIMILPSQFGLWLMVIGYLLILKKNQAIVVCILELVLMVVYGLAQLMH